MKKLNVRPELWLIALTLFVAGWAAWRTSTTSAHTQTQKWFDQGTTAPFKAPAILIGKNDDAVIWQQSESTPGLVYRELGGSPVPIVAYADVHPQSWQAAPAGSDQFHLVWLEQDGRLRNALISRTGETIRGPIELTPKAQSEFIIVPYQEQLLVFWLTSSGQLTMTGLDDQGRPLVSQQPVRDHMRFIAAALDHTGMLHLVWLVSSTPEQWEVRYQTSTIDQIGAGTPATLFRLTMSPDEAPVSFSMGLDQTHGYLFWSTSKTDQPDSEKAYTWAFPLGEAQNGTLSEIRLSKKLRWARPAQGQNDFLPVALSVQTPSGWRPAVVNFRDGQRGNLQILSDQLANAGPSTAAVMSNGNTLLAWPSLTGVTPHLLTTTAGEPRQQHTTHVSDALIAGLVRLPLGFLWLAVPVGLVWLSPQFAPLSAVLYAAAKIIWPTDLFAAPPAGLERFKPAFASGITILLIGLMAGGIWGITSRLKSPFWIRWTAFLLVDALLTWLIFGVNAW